MHLILASEVVVQACLEKTTAAMTSILDAVGQRGDQAWIYAGSVSEITRQVPSAKVKEITGACQWLSCLSGEAQAALEPGDVEMIQLALALKRLGKDARLITTKADRLTTHPNITLSPEAYRALPVAAKPVPFIDLEKQQSMIRSGLEAALDTVLHHGQYILGPEIKELEKQLADYVGVKHAITVASGTDSLLIALMALDVGPGDEIITVPYTWISTAEVIALLRAKTVFVDIEPDTMNLNPDQLEQAITPRTKAIMPVGIYGQCADMTRINAIAAKHGIPVIEDAAQCFGARHHGKRSCGLSLVGSTSFFPSKPLGCYGDGGALFTPDDALADKMRQIRVHGQKVKHQHPLVGINGRFDTLQAAVVLEKLKIFDEECRLRTEVAERYNRLFAGIPGVTTPRLAPGNTSVYAQYTILVQDPDVLSANLQKKKIPAVSYYRVPLHLQGAFKDLGYKAGDFPVSERIASQCLSLPMAPYMTEAEQKLLVDAIRG